MFLVRLFSTKASPHFISL